MEKSDVVIIGCGPAGIAAAIQLRRYGIEPVVFEKNRIGGLLINAHLVENYPGFPEGIQGTELVDLMGEHIRRLSVDIVFGEVTSLDLGKRGFAIETPGRSFESGIAVIASGTRPKTTDTVAFSAHLEGRVLYEIYPIRGVRGKRILIVGSGDAAFDYALSLGSQNGVTIVNRSSRVKCLRLLWKRAEASRGIKYLDETTPISLAPVGNDEIEVTCRTPGDYRTLRVDYVILATGREPELGFVTEGVMGNLKMLQETGVLHLVGDVRTGSMRQAAIAVGDGVIAAIRICRKIEDLRR